MSATETIVSFAAKQVIDRVFGGATRIVTAYHKTHFIVLARAIAEANRDAKIQESLSEVKKNINGLTDAGGEILRAIPDPPVPPSSDLSLLVDRQKAGSFQKQCEIYGKGVQAVITILEEYIARVDECINKTETQLRFIQRKLNMENAKWAAMRQISNRARQTDIDFLLIGDIPDLKKQANSAKSLLQKYKNQ
jgi:FlaA1/EpsC-like NDP-sugar epimerase